YFDHLAALIPCYWTHTREPFHLRIRSENIRHEGKGLRQILVVAVEPSHDLSSRFRKPLVHGIILALIRLTHPIRQTIFVSTDDLCASIGRTTIDHNIFQPGVPLVED